MNYHILHHVPVYTHHLQHYTDYLPSSRTPLVPTTCTHPKVHWHHPPLYSHNTLTQPALIPKSTHHLPSSHTYTHTTHKHSSIDAYSCQPPYNSLTPLPQPLINIDDHYTPNCHSPILRPHHWCTHSTPINWRTCTYTPPNSLRPLPSSNNSLTPTTH